MKADLMKTPIDKYNAQFVIDLKVIKPLIVKYCLTFYTITILTFILEAGYSCTCNSFLSSCLCLMSEHLADAVEIILL